LGRPLDGGTGAPPGERQAKKADYPSGLLENDRVIDAPDDLNVWLDEHLRGDEAKN